MRKYRLVAWIYKSKVEEIMDGLPIEYSFCQGTVFVSIFNVPPGEPRLIEYVLDDPSTGFVRIEEVVEMDHRPTMVDALEMTARRIKNVEKDSNSDIMSLRRWEDDNG